MTPTPEQMSALEQWRKWTKSEVYPPDYPEVAQHTEELAHNAINELLARLAAVKRERDRLEAAFLASAPSDTPIGQWDYLRMWLARYDAAHPAPEEEADRG